MPEEMAAKALTALGRYSEIRAVELAGSMSQSSVYLVRLNGQDAVLKVAGVDEERDLVRRELAFYRTLADRAPVRTPTLLDSADSDELTAIVLTAHTPAPSAPEWNDDAWLDLTRQLVELHDFDAPDSPALTSTPWIQRVLDEPPLGAAEKYWSHTVARSHVGGVLDKVDAFADALDAVPRSFLHGDCHVGNLLCEGGELVWADWAVTGHGSPAVDLAFACGRARADGAHPPYDAMLREYANLRGIDHDEFRRSMLAAELTTLLFGWPEHAHYHSQDEQARTIQRLTRRLDDWRTLAV